MLATVLFVAVVGGSFLNVESADIFRCDKHVIAKVTNLWNGDIPNGVLEKAISYDKLYFKASTPNFINDQLKGVYVYFTKEDGYIKETLYLIPKEGSVVAKAERQVTESGGVIKERGNSKVNYPVYADNGIIAVYSCLDSDKAPKGHPAAYVFTKESGYTKKDYKTAISKLKDIGIKSLVTFSYKQ